MCCILTKDDEDDPTPDYGNSRSFSQSGQSAYVGGAVPVWFLFFSLRG